MRNGLMIIISLWITTSLPAQSVEQRLQKAYTAFEADSQLRHAISSLYVIDAKTGKVVFEKNAQTGLAPASTQKIITSVTAFELLGKDYRYKTSLGYSGRITKGTLDGSVYITGKGDPTLGSWRWPATSDSVVLRSFTTAIKKAGIQQIKGPVLGLAVNYSVNNIPDGWIWQDIGNYYGAGAGALNWKENQFEMRLRSGDKIGDSVKMLDDILADRYTNELTTAAKGSGDNAYIYYNNVVTGTIPAGEKAFSISGAMLQPAEEMVMDLALYLAGNSIQSVPKNKGSYVLTYGNKVDRKLIHDVYTHYSPSLDSIIYWFNKKSINLYGEALIKTFALEKEGTGSTDKGVKIVRDFWKQKGINEAELNIRDGSGLSPLNRVTTHAQVEILKYAKTKSWFPSFYNALPEYNNMHMKSGTISDVKGFCGYHTSADGREYIFSFLVNNYTGAASSLVRKMYKVLDELK